MKKELYDIIADDCNKRYHKAMKQLNEKQNNQNSNTLLDPELKKEVQTINQKCEYCLFNDINITLTENDVNKYFLMKLTGKTKVAKLYEVNISKNEFAFVASDGIVCITNEKGISNKMTDVCVVKKLEHFPNIDLTENTNYGDIFITKNGNKLKYVYKLSSLNNQEFIYIFTDDNKVYHYNRYGEYEAYNNGINLYVKYEENISNNKLLDIATDIIKQSNDNFKDLMKQFNENTQPLDNKQNTIITNNDDYNKKYNHTQYKETQEEERKKQQEQEFELYKEQARKICLEKNIETTDEELENLAALFCAKNSKELPMDLTKFQQQTKHINELIDKLDNEYSGDIRDKVLIKNEDTAIDIIRDFPLKIDSIYVNEEDLSIIYVKSICPSKRRKEFEILTDTYMFNNEEEYVLYKNEYYTYDFSDLCKNYTIEQLKLYREISKEEVNNVINNIKIMHDNINEIKKQFKNLLKNLIFINKNY